MKKLRILLAVPMLILLGCVSGITVTHVTDGDSKLVGVPWNLPMTQFTITITRHIVSCTGEVKGAIEVLPSAAITVDPEQRYLLTSTGWLATSEITSNLAPSGVSTGLNAASTDQTGAVISSVLGTAAQIAIGVAAGSAPVPTDSTELCNDDVARAVAELYPPNKPTLKETVEKHTADLAIATARVAVATAQAVADKDNKELKAALIAALKTQADAQDMLTKDQARLTSNLKITTDVQVVTWPHVASEFRRDTPYLPDQKVLDKWLKPTADNAAARAKFSVFLALYSLDADGQTWGLPAKPATADVKVGVPVRLARTARLLMCVAEQCVRSVSATDRLTKNQSSADFVVLQTGRMYVLPVTGGAFKSESAAITLDANGLPTVLQTAEKAAAAAGAANAAKDAATQWAALPAAVRAAELAKTKTKTEQINADAALATAQATAGLTGQTTTLTAQTALINAQTALANAKENAGLQSQTAGLTAQTAVLNAQAALATAQANAQVVDRTSVLAAEAALINAEAAKLNAAAALAKAQATTTP